MHAPTTARRLPAPVPIQDLRCVSVSFSNGERGETCTIGEAVSSMSGQPCGEEPAHVWFLATGGAATYAATYVVLGTPEEVAERLAAYREYSDGCFRKAMGRYTVGELSER